MSNLTTETACLLHLHLFHREVCLIKRKEKEKKECAHLMLHKRCLKKRKKPNIKTKFFISWVYSTIHTYTANFTDVSHHPLLPSSAQWWLRGGERGLSAGVWNSAIPAPVNSAETWQIIVEICMSVDLTWNCLRGSSGICLSTCLPLKWAWFRIHI